MKKIKSVSLEEDLIEKIEIESKKNGRTFSNMVNFILEMYINSIGQGKGGKR